MINYELQIEICCYSIEDAVLAQKNGADRIEFCAGRELGGISPSKESIIEVLEEIKIPVYIMIRPRGGNFIYNEAEIKWMCNEMEWAATVGVSGFVFGCLHDNDKLDIANCRILIDSSNGLSCTFHRAFDSIAISSDNYPQEAIDNLSELGFTRILTSGGIGNAENNIMSLKNLIAYSKNNMIIMPGGGIRPNNVLQIVDETQCKEIHSSDCGIIVVKS